MSTPRVKSLPYDRFRLIDLLPGRDLVGIELGVAAGDFSSRMVASGRFREFFGVDLYGDHHNTEEYLCAIARVGIFAPFKLLRMSFDEAATLFADNTFDLVYVDGYAHTGQDGGETIFSWLPKVRVNGVLAGHDYHHDWPLVVAAVNHLCQQTGFELLVTKLTESPGPQDAHPSWAVLKTSSAECTPLYGVAGAVKLARNPGTSESVLTAPLSIRARESLRIMAGTRGVKFYRKWLKRARPPQ